MVTGTVVIGLILNVSLATPPKIVSVTKPVAGLGLFRLTVQLTVPQFTVTFVLLLKLIVSKPAPTICVWPGGPSTISIAVVDGGALNVKEVAGTLSKTGSRFE